MKKKDFPQKRQHSESFIGGNSQTMRAFCFTLILWTSSAFILSASISHSSIYQSVELRKFSGHPIELARANFLLFNLNYILFTAFWKFCICIGNLIFEVYWLESIHSHIATFCNYPIANALRKYVRFNTHFTHIYIFCHQHYFICHFCLLAMLEYLFWYIYLYIYIEESFIFDFLIQFVPYKKPYFRFTHATFRHQYIKSRTNKRSNKKKHTKIDWHQIYDWTMAVSAPVRRDIPSPSKRKRNTSNANGVEQGNS